MCRYLLYKVSDIIDVAAIHMDIFNHCEKSLSERQQVSMDSRESNTTRRTIHVKPLAKMTILRGDKNHLV